MEGILLSGGLDSTALAYLCKPDIAFNIDYGQNSAAAERNASKAICKDLGIQLVEIDIDCKSLGSGDLSGKPSINQAPESDWWPYRNQLLITLCCMKAVSMGCKQILIGTVQSDVYHADGTIEFIEKINQLISYQEGYIKIKAPAINLSATELIKKSKIPFNLLAWAHSCHKSVIPCTNCRGCNKYYATMQEIGFFKE
ncbi:7-cyano-7-deazaguanine synthase [Kangiella sp. TOML190]|uniref:7-cyano-7-deazaguanine synthase n=1 Tax=Kangiella sp. TOML190 TaxID=2931351 RepID=UPI00203A68B2|nr:7-cyano-7-deazaguanine synthase [Kangiella sp. TOML190]